MNGNGQVNFPDRFHGSPEAQQPKETGRAHTWFLKFLYMNNRKLQDIVDYSVEQRQLVKDGTIEGFFPAAGTIHDWAKKYKWKARSDAWDSMLREEAIKKMNDGMAENIEEFLKNDLAIVMDLQIQIKEYMAECKTIANPNERSHVLFKLTKTYGDARGWAKELLGDVEKKLSKEEADNAEADNEQNAGFDGSPEQDTEHQNNEYQEAAG